MSEITRPVLAADDEESDRMILQLVFRRAKLSRSLVLVRDGQEAVDYLSGSGDYADRLAYPLPGLVVLDLKMPRMNGFDVLAWLATQTSLREVPTVVLSSSADESDIKRARQLGRSRLLRKASQPRKVYINCARDGAALAGRAIGATVRVASGEMADCSSLLCRGKSSELEFDITEALANLAQHAFFISQVFGNERNAETQVSPGIVPRHGRNELFRD